MSAKKKHVRFTSLEDQEDQEDQGDQEDDPLFGQRDGGTPGTLEGLLAAGSGGGGRWTGTLKGLLAAGSGGGGRWTVTLVLCASFLGLGMSISVLGPTFQDLADNLQCNISSISFLFVGRSAGYLSGSLLGGALFDCMNPHLLLGCSLLLTAAGMCAVPFCKVPGVLTGLMSSVGVSMGVLDTGGNVLVLQTWAHQAGPHMQALHFSFAVGAFVSPVIAKLLITTDSAPPTLPAPPTNNSGTRPVAAAPFSRPIMSSLYVYVFIGCFVLLAALVFLLLLLRGGMAARPPGGPLAPPRARRHAALILLLSLFFFWYVGAEVAFGSFIFSYAVNYAGLAPREAAGLNALFWGAFAACRGLAVPLATRLSPAALILSSLAGSSLSALLLCLFGQRRAVLWVCTGFYGASMAAIFPSGMSWAEQRTVVSGRSAAGLVVGAALGEMVLPTLLSLQLGRSQEEPLLMYLILLAAAITCTLFPVMCKLTSDPVGDRQALLDALEEEDEPDQRNHADFEMDDAPRRPHSAGLPPVVMATQPSVTSSSDSQQLNPARETRD